MVNYLLKKSFSGVETSRSVPENVDAIGDKA